MRLVYLANPTQEVAIGDTILLNDSTVTVEYFRPPHSPASSGRVTVRDVNGHSNEFYVGVIGAEWIEREDRA